ncbi:MAG: hypothetical protein IJ512_05820 [Ruminococcus sp.]|nr:hypothetical protein [Ruminococcus sp.]
MNGSKRIELTDEMVYEVIHRENMEGYVFLILFAIAAVCIFFAGIISVIIRKKKENPKKKLKITDGEFILIGAVVLVIGCIAGGMLFRSHQNVTYDEAWRMTTGTVSELYSVHGRHGHNSYYAYVEGCNRKVPVSQSDYNILEEGDAVYVVLDYEGEGIGLWRMERYTYVGERLMDQLK